ncbi:unnamed protein product [Orchesella dallaii]|uniref:F-box domain-containing protein n=1 Tax=Orchesella dallaii TaxID=48710 RepID=A0ABP1R8N2_9HEXA
MAEKLCQVPNCGNESIDCEVPEHVLERFGITDLSLSRICPSCLLVPSDVHKNFWKFAIPPNTVAIGDVDDGGECVSFAGNNGTDGIRKRKHGSDCKTGYSKEKCSRVPAPGPSSQLLGMGVEDLSKYWHKLPAEMKNELLESQVACKNSSFLFKMRLVNQTLKSLADIILKKQYSYIYKKSWPFNQDRDVSEGNWIICPSVKLDGFTLAELRVNDCVANPCKNNLKGLEIPTATVLIDKRKEIFAWRYSYCISIQSFMFTFGENLSYLIFTNIGYKSSELVKILQKTINLKGLSLINACFEGGENGSNDAELLVPQLPQLTFLNVTNHSTEFQQETVGINSIRKIIAGFGSQITHLAIDASLCWEFNLDIHKVHHFHLSPFASAKLKKLFIHELDDENLDYVNDVWSFVEHFSGTLEHLHFGIDFNMFFWMRDENFRVHTRFPKVKILEVPFPDRKLYVSLLKERILPQFPKLETLTFLNTYKREDPVDTEEKGSVISFVSQQEYVSVCPNLKCVSVFPRVNGSFKIELSKPKPT